MIDPPARGSAASGSEFWSDIAIGQSPNASRTAGPSLQVRASWASLRHLRDQTYELCTANPMTELRAAQAWAQ